ncbi:MAG: hypothetical protein HOC91_19430 [Nitrospinaceae bacterium]|nr:hypothetical protein [Nitrospinaceae bacterium]MBT3435707.1 hypothetical protein [Nitrospinaceae bacterium]MBT3820332.1 hypothetical protein [Nitrospinaceae bacterium]MBT4432689.1 hypothetical protein [Nitrospinaceae bacterium]MBT5367371.1 hypothetical protein [Nitrospinaceae bacterium]
MILENKLDHIISSQQWRLAQRELLQQISDGFIDVSNYDLWGKYAGEIDRGLEINWSARETFWRALNSAVRQAELVDDIQTHKGLIYFKIGGLSLLTGRSFKTAMKWLNEAHKEDERLWEIHHEKLPQEQAARRLFIILKAFDQYCKKIRNVNVKSLIMNHLLLNRLEIAQQFIIIFDRSIQEQNSLDPISFRGVGDRTFERLLGRNKFRVTVQQNYDAARWLCGHKEEINKPPTLEKYGLAQATIALCGATLEGVLFSMRSLREQIRKSPLKKPKRKTSIQKKNNRKLNYNLSLLLGFYLQNKHVSPDLAASLIFIWFARDEVHPELANKNYDLHIDMYFADFVWTLTGNVLGQLAKKSRRKI